MKVPNFARIKAVDKEGNFTDEIHNFFDVLLQQMQGNLSDEGIVFPPLSQSDINKIVSSKNPNKKGNATTFFNSDTNQLQILINGVVKTFTVT
jgi:hypothetical protein